MFTLRHPWFNPVWRRAIVTAFLVLWGLFEATGGALFWAAVFVGAGAAAGWVFFVDWKDVPEDET